MDGGTLPPGGTRPIRPIRPVVPIQGNIVPGGIRPIQPIAPTQVVPVVQPPAIRPLSRPVISVTQPVAPAQIIQPIVPAVPIIPVARPQTTPAAAVTPQPIVSISQPVESTRPPIVPIIRPPIVPIVSVPVTRPQIVPIVKPPTQVKAKPPEALPPPQVTLMDIDANIPTILQLLKTESCLQIVAPTGSGKSLAVPRAVSRLDFGSATKPIKCSVVVPTRTAAITLAERQRELYKQEHPEVIPKQLESLIGYAANRVIKYGSLITYMTAGHAKRKLLSYFQDGQVSAIDFTNVIIVDEYHTALTDLTVIQELLHLATQAGVVTPIPVFMSATATGLPFQCATYTMPMVTRFPISYVYQPRSYSLGQLNQLYADTAKVIVQYHLTTPVNSGHILVFAAGSSEIDKINEGLTILSANKDVVILPAYGALTAAELAKIYTNYGPNRRKIILATNIGESAITIPDIGYVVDTMYEKRQETSNSGGKRLKLHLESKDSAIQRAGRTGRTRAGVCHRMLTQQDYQKLEEHRTPEITRVPIYDVILELLSSGIDPLVIRELSPARIKQATQQLIKLGMLIKEGNRYLVTDLGKFAATIPLSVHNSAFLYQWLQVSQYAYIGIVLTVLIDSYGPSYFHLPKKDTQESQVIYKQRVKEYKQKYFAKIIGYSELATVVNMWTTLVDALGGNLNKKEKALIKWCSQNSVRLDKIQEVIKIWRQITPVIADLGHDTQIMRFTPDGALNLARPILSQVYADSVFLHAGGLNYRRGKTIYRLDAKNGVNTLIDKPAKTVLGLMTREIVRGQHTDRLLDLYLDLPIMEKAETTLANKIYQILIPSGLRKKYPTLSGILDDSINLEALYDIYLNRTPAGKWSGPGVNRLIRAQEALVPLQILLKFLPRRSVDVWGQDVPELPVGELRVLSSGIVPREYVYQNPWVGLPGERTAVLDFGSGDGTKGYVFGEMTGYPVLYSDIDDHRIAPAKSGPFLQYAYDQPLDIPGRYIVGVSIFHALHHIPTDIEVETRLRDIHRVLMDGGVLFIREHDADSDASIHELDNLHLAYEINEIPAGMSLADFIQWLEGRIQLNLHNREDWSELMRAAGFQLLATTPAVGNAKDYFGAYLKISDTTKDVAERMLTLLDDV